MIEVFGYSLEVLTLVQIGTTTMIVGLYATLTSLGEQRANYQSAGQMCLLISFVIDEHPTIKKLEHVVGMDQEDIDSRNDDLMYFSKNFEEFKSSGFLPLPDRFSKTSLLEQFGVIFLSPIFGPWFAAELYQEGRRHASRVRNTEIRKNYFSKSVLVAIGGIGFLLVGAAIFPHAVAGVMMLLAVLAILSAVAGVLVLSFEQQSWKTYWTDRLSEILAAQDQEKAHDQFNRALLLSNFINEQPDVPFPGRLGLYTGVYSIVQGLILLVNSRFGGGA